MFGRTASSLPQLPCLSHRSCTFHEHWTPPSGTDDAAPKNSSIITTKTPTGDDNKYTANRERVIQKSQVVQELSPLESLPTELLHVLVDFLSPADQACLALTCRSLAHVLGTEVWMRMSKAGNASWGKHMDMLDILQRDLSSDEYWLCKECMQFHVRRKSMPKAPGARGLLGIGSKLSRVLSPRVLWRTTEKSLRLGVRGDPIHGQDVLYEVNDHLQRAVMDRHRQGLSVGICLKALKCASVRSYYLTETTNVVLRYEFEPKIVLDRLLLQSTYTWSTQQTMFIRNVKIERPSLKTFLEHMDFWICGHERTSRFMPALQESTGLSLPPPSDAPAIPKNVRNRLVYKNRRCAFCPTQYDVRMVRHGDLCISVWQNLGSGFEAEDPRWAHITRIGTRRRKYVWGKVNLEEAFGRILCSTKEEFQRQVERSDGRGSWYDPELKQRAYKTLPTTFVDRL